ncbi:hypothetical protein GCM10010196_10620 [Agromyces mediolanus]|uniref:Uncharacterized protein n=1 Tax=Agromyces mediolanus TaxID=41986 RepID=A0A918CFE1_AGRME|nr:hypothetical protein GCM10010196_10620 [Agromyces mediolanus]GLJ71323.1 hypothetical protein GCM10017583_05790 [Agromyces mediolanus]
MEVVSSGARRSALSVTPSAKISTAGAGAGPGCGPEGRRGGIPGLLTPEPEPERQETNIR